MTLTPTPRQDARDPRQRGQVDLHARARSDGPRPAEPPFNHPVVGLSPIRFHRRAQLARSCYSRPPQPRSTPPPLPLSSVSHVRLRAPCRAWSLAFSFASVFTPKEMAAVRDLFKSSTRPVRASKKCSSRWSGSETLIRLGRSTPAPAVDHRRCGGHSRMSKTSTPTRRGRRL